MTTNEKLSNAKAQLYTANSTLSNLGSNMSAYSNGPLNVSWFQQLMSALQQTNYALIEVVSLLEAPNLDELPKK